MISPKNAKTIAAVLAAHLACRGVDAHGYLKTPRSRNYYASIDPIWSGGTAEDPAPENCPHCLNIGGTEARCGKVGDHNYDYPPNAIGEGVLSPAIQACYGEAAVIDIESVLTAHHKGHFEVRACPISSTTDSPMQECFDDHPLTFVSDELYGAPPDPLYPERAYIPLAERTERTEDGNYLFHHMFKLPDGLRGDLILIQWYYVTANSCKDEGYDTYDWPEGFYPGDIPVCDVIPPDGRGVPEQFWNCAEVEIRVANDCSTSSPAASLPTSLPIASPSKDPTPSPSKGPTSTNATSTPSYQPTDNPTASPINQDNETTTTTSSTSVNTGATVTTTTSTITSTNTPNPNCLAQSARCSANNPCADGLCCSQWGHCGTSAAYCGNCCQSGNCWDGPPSPSTSPTQGPTSSPIHSPTMAPIAGIASPTHYPTMAPIAGTNSPTTYPSTSPTKSPNKIITTTSTTRATATTTSTSSSSSGGELVLDKSPRCGFSEIDARENCKTVCANDSDCLSGDYCWRTHANYCGSIPQRVYADPVQSPVVSRCGVSEEMARTFCGELCSWECSKPGESCIAVHSNYCDSPYTEVGVGTTTTQATSSSTTSVSTTNGTGASTNSPSKSPTEAPTESPTSAPMNSSPTTLFPSTSPISPPPTSSAAAAVEYVLEANKDGIDNNILLYQTPSMSWEPSTVYRYKDLLDGLRVMYNDGVANKFFFMGDDSPNGHLYGLVNIAAFLAQSMKETIKYNACDENSWDLVNGKYALSNACGQLGQSYQDYKCSASEAHMECPVKTDMEITATTNAKWWGAPAPLFCGPKEKYPLTGYWDHSKECDKSWANPPEYCDVYDGQLAGGFDNSAPIMNSAGRTDVEGCCFWGRGVIQTTGVCNFGKLNYYLGSRAAKEGRDARYPDIDFCEQPDAICASEEHKELKWIAGMFYWVESLQSYNVGGWDYITELKKFVDDDGMSGNSFIDAVSGIVNRGCHDPPCATGDVDGKTDRSFNFFKVLTELDVV